MRNNSPSQPIVTLFVAFFSAVAVAEPLHVQIDRHVSAPDANGFTQPPVLRIDGGLLPAPLTLNYLEAYCRADSTDADWVKHTVIPHRTEILECREDGSCLRLRDTLADGLVVHHTITAGEDAIDFRLRAHNPTSIRSEAHWAQPCLRVGEFTGSGVNATSDTDAYLSHCFVFIDGKQTHLPTTPWASQARYTPGQVWRPAHVPASDVNPRPLSSHVPSHGLIGCESADGRIICATAWEPYQELFQGIVRCIHSDLRLGGIAAGASLEVRGKIYVVPNDPGALLKQYRQDFPEHRPVTSSGVIRTIVGNGSKATVGQPFGVEYGPDGKLYICEVENHRLLRWDPTSGQLETIAGTGIKGYGGDGGPAREAELNEPYEVRFDRSGNIYFVEMRNHVVRRIDAESGVITTVAGIGKAGFSGDGGKAIDAQLSSPHSIALDHRGGLYIADIGNHRIRRVDLASGTIKTVAGNGKRKLPTEGQAAAGTPMAGPRALAIDGHTLWIALREGHSVWKVDLDRGILRHVAGTGKRGYSGDGGPAAEATLNGPKGIALDADGNVLVVDTENQVIRRIHVRTGAISTIAGKGPTARGYGGDNANAVEAKMDRPHGIGLGPTGNIVIGDTNNHRVREVRP